jgi:gluconokinase
VRPPDDRDHGRNGQRDIAAGYRAGRQPEDVVERRGAWMSQQQERVPGDVIIVMGVSGSGKSTLAAMLAERMGCRFLEGDDYHSAASVAKMHGGEPLTDADRWPWLDALGGAIRQTAIAGRYAVVACSALRRVYRERLRAVIGAPVRFVFLDAERAELVRRLNRRIGHYMPANLIDSQLATLERPVPAEGALTLRELPPPAELCRDVLLWLEEGGASPPPVIATPHDRSRHQPLPALRKVPTHR